MDLIVEIASRGDYYRFAEALRFQGFTEHLGEDAPVCRWRVDGIIVDVMPTSAEILGFSNRWYSRAMQTATAMRIADSLTIRIVTAPYFIATNLDAFWSRGKGDFRDALPGQPLHSFPRIVARPLLELWQKPDHAQGAEGLVESLQVTSRHVSRSPA